MASGIFLGGAGAVHLARREGSNVGNVAVRTTLMPSDVNATDNLLSFSYLDFDIGQPPITTGDFIMIKRVDVGGPVLTGDIVERGVGYADGTYTNQLLRVFDPSGANRDLRVDATVVNGQFATIAFQPATATNLQISQVGDRLTVDGTWPGANPNVPLIFEITRIDGSGTNVLILKDGVIDEADMGAWANVNQAAELSLYETYEAAINAKESERISLVEHTANQEIEVTIERTRERCLAQVKNFSIATSRELVNATALGEQHQKQYEQGLIQGQGKLDCFWQYSDCPCEYSNVTDLTFAQYLADICLRVNLGAAFHGFFFLHESPDVDGSSVWYECDECIVSNVALEVVPGEAVEASIDFVMSGPITLRTGCRPLLLALQSGQTLAGQQGQSSVNLGFGLTCQPPSTGTVSLTMPADWTATSIDNQYYDNVPGQCSGANSSPALAWAYVGSGTVASWSLRLTDVLTNTSQTFVHYDVTGIPAATVDKALGVDPVGGTVNPNYKPTSDYAGPCPPAGSGQHTYTWTVSALDAGGAVLASDSFDAVITA